MTAAASVWLTPCGSKSNASGSSSPTVVVMRRPPGRPRWTGVSGAANSASRWRQPPQGGQNSMWRGGHRHLDDPRLARRRPGRRAPRSPRTGPAGTRRSRRSSPRTPGRPRRAARRRPGSASTHVSRVHHLVGGAQKLVATRCPRRPRPRCSCPAASVRRGRRRLEQEVGVARGDEVLVLDPELRAQPLDLVVLGREVRARLGNRLELEVACRGRRRRRGGCARPPRAGDGGASRPSRASRTRRRAPPAAAPRRRPARRR